jgi:hypothetical protein
VRALQNQVEQLEAALARRPSAATPPPASESRQALP